MSNNTALEAKKQALIPAGTIHASGLWPIQLRLLQTLRDIRNSKLTPRDILMRKAYLPDSVTGSCRRILVAMIGDHDPIPALLYFTTSDSGAKYAGYISLAHALDALLQHLAKRCKRIRPLITQLIEASPIYRSGIAVDIDLAIGNACDSIKHEYDYIPKTHRAEPLKYKILALLRRGLSHEEIKRKCKYKYRAAEVDAILGIKKDLHTKIISIVTKTPITLAELERKLHRYSYAGVKKAVRDLIADGKLKLDPTTSHPGLREAKKRKLRLA